MLTKAYPYTFPYFPSGFSRLLLVDFGLMPFMNRGGEMNCLSGSNIMKLLPLFFAALLPIYLTGCGGLPFTPNDTAYFTNKVESTLGKGYLKKLDTNDFDNKLTVMITLNATPENEENYSLKVMHAFARDPLLPNVDSVCVLVEQTKAVAFSRQLLIAVAQGVVQGLTGLGSPNNSSQEIITTFSVFSTRDALLKGEEPRVIFRNGLYASGPHKGQSVDEAFFGTKKSEETTKQEAPPTNKNDSPSELAKDK